jgi:hypothetical protein
MLLKNKTNVARCRRRSLKNDSIYNEFTLGEKVTETQIFSMIFSAAVASILICHWAQTHARAP